MVRDGLLIECAKDQLSRGVENVNTHEMGQVIDMIKDLAEAEKACWEACYYKSVVDAMDEESWGGRYGYDDGVRSGDGRGGSHQDRMGYKNQYGNFPANPKNRGRSYSSRMGGRRGYSEESIDNIRDIMRNADPARREQLKKDLHELMQEM